MTFAELSAGTAIFLDANTLIYHFIADPTFGPACTELLDRIEQAELPAYSSAHVLGEVVHRLMTHEASMRLNWPLQGIAQRLKRHPAEVQRLVRYRQALDEVPLIGIHVLPNTEAASSRAADISRQYGLLTNDALIVAVMRDQGLTHLASHDADFDRVPGLTRYAPV